MGGCYAGETRITTAGGVEVGEMRGWVREKGAAD